VGPERATSYRTNIGKTLMAQNQPAEAIPHLEAGLQEMEAIGTELIWEPYQLLSQAYEQTGDYQRALLYRDKYFKAYSGMLEGKVTNLESAELAEPNSYFLTDRIFVRHKDKIVKVDIDDIHLVKADGSYCLVYTSGNEYILTFPMKSLEDYLPRQKFIRTHRSYLINLDKIEAITDNQEVLLLGNQLQAPISRRYKQAVLERLRMF